MLLKRLYHPRPVVDGKPGEPKQQDGVIRILRLGRKQKFSDTLIAAGIKEGWLTMGRGKITLHGEKGDVVMMVVRVPGYYCCHCGVQLEGDPKIPDGAAGAAKRAVHVAEKHPGEKSPDPENPAGYMGTHSIKAVREVSNG